MITTRLLFIAHFPSDRQVRGLKIALPMKSRGTGVFRFLQLFVILGFLCSVQPGSPCEGGIARIYCCLPGALNPFFCPCLWDQQEIPLLPTSMGSFQAIFFKLHTSLSPFWSYFTPSPSLHSKAVWPKLSSAESRWELLPDASLALWRGSCRHRGTEAPQGSGICPVHNSH